MDIIEAGFPIASPGRLRESVRTIARQVHGPVICGLARCNPADIHRAGRRRPGGGPAPHPRVHLASSDDPHPEFQLKHDDRATTLQKRPVEMVKPWPRACATTSSSPPMDATRSEVGYLHRDAGRKVIRRSRGDHAEHPGHGRVRHPGRLPRTMFGGILPKGVPGASTRCVLIHTHPRRSRGWPWPTPWPGSRAGARQVECTINGIGERAGNTALEESRDGPADPPRLLQTHDRHQHPAAFAGRAGS